MATPREQDEGHVAPFLVRLLGPRRFAQLGVSLGTKELSKERAAWLVNLMASTGTRKLRPIRPTKREARDAIRGIAETRDTRFTAKTGLQVLAEMAPSGLGRERPFAHPIYWAAAIVFGA